MCQTMFRPKVKFYIMYKPASDVPNSTSSRETSHISFHHVPSERKISYVSRWSGRKPLNLVSEDEGFESTV